MTLTFYYNSQEEKKELSSILIAETNKHFKHAIIQQIDTFNFTVDIPDDEFLEDLEMARRSVYETNKANDWNDIKYSCPEPLTKSETDDTKYLVKIIYGEIRIATGTEIAIDMAHGCFIQYWKNIETEEVLFKDFISDVEENLSFVTEIKAL